MLALTIGLVVFSHQRHLLGSPGWLLVGLLSSMILYFLHSYVAFFAGLALAVFVTSLLPHLTKRLLCFHPGKVLPIAVLTNFSLILLSVWVVAYNFVPGGVVTRERSDVLLAATVLMIGWGARNPLSSGKEKEEEEEEKAGGGKKRERVARKLSTITEESGEEEWDCGSSGSIHEERVKDVLLAEEKECRAFRHRITTGQNCLWLAVLAVHLSPHHSCHSNLSLDSPVFCLPLPASHSSATQGSYAATHPTMYTPSPPHPLTPPRSTLTLSVLVSGPSTLAMTTMPTPVWNGLLSSSRMQVSVC